MPWPSTLPLPLRSGYAIEIQDATVRTDMEGGAARTRRRSTSVPDKIPLRYRFDDAQLQTFRDFWKTDFMHGAAWVSMPIRDGYSADVVNKECKPFPATFKAVPAGPNSWIVEMTVEVRNA